MQKKIEAELLYIRRHKKNFEYENEHTRKV